MRWVAIGWTVVLLACGESAPPDNGNAAGSGSVECATQLVRDECAVSTSGNCPADTGTLDSCVGTVSSNRCGPFANCLAEYDALLECLAGGSMVCVEDRNEFTGSDCRAVGGAFTACMDYDWLCSSGSDGECHCGRASTAGSDDASCPPPPTTGCCWERLGGNSCRCSPDPEVCQAYADVSTPVESCPPP